MRSGPGFTHDEQGGRSMGRLLLASTSIYIYVIIWAETFFHFAVSGPAWALLSTMEAAFTLWTAGPRIAQYLAPVLQKGLDAVQAAVAKRRANGETESTP